MLNHPVRTIFSLIVIVLITYFVFINWNWICSVFDKVLSTIRQYLDMSKY